MKKINNEFSTIFPETSTIVMLHAHADDESFLSAGIINEFIKKGYRLVLIFCAAGIVENEYMTIVRQKELLVACGRLGISEIYFLKYCEPKYTKGNPLCVQPPVTVAEVIVVLLHNLKIAKPVLFSYDKNGGYGNKDHVVVHNVGRIVMELIALDYIFEVTLSRDLYTKWFNIKKEIVDISYLPQLEYWRKDFGLKNNEIDFVFSLGKEQIHLKRKVLSDHISQIRNDEFPMTLSDADFKYLFGSEYFHLYQRIF